MLIFPRALSVRRKTRVELQVVLAEEARLKFPTFIRKIYFSFRFLFFYQQCLYRQSLESRNRPPIWSNHQCLFRSFEDLFACSRSSNIDFDALYITDQNSSVGNEGLDAKASRHKCPMSIGEGDLNYSGHQQVSVMCLDCVASS